MIHISDMRTYGWEAAIIGMRNPLDSWERSDTYLEPVYSDGSIALGEDDTILMWRLMTAGPDHGKYMRFITVTMDISAPLYWWKEWDTYKVGTVANSCSTMHTITKYKFDHSMFAQDRLDENGKIILDIVINALNERRTEYLKYRKLWTTDKSYEERMKNEWDNIIQLLPSSWLQKRTVQVNYEVLRRMYAARRHHKLQEWRDFCEFIEEDVPYSFLITGNQEEYEDYLSEVRIGVGE